MTAEPMVSYRRSRGLREFGHSVVPAAVGVALILTMSVACAQGIQQTATSFSGRASTAQTATPKVQASKAGRTLHWFEVGKASWYGPRFQGKKTANGEWFDMNELTCAHRSLPLGSWIRVTNLKNKRSVFVRVNDRGPVPEDRVVDLSYAAARVVGIAGLGKVKLEVVRGGDAALARGLVAQLQIPVIPTAGQVMAGQ